MSMPNRFSENHISYRLANSADIELVYNWSNDELVRKQSFHPDKISFKSHTHWFNRKIKSKSDLLFIALINNIPAALVRIEGIPENSVIGVLLDKEYRGLGISSRILIETSNLYFSEYSTPIMAYIKDSNIASKKSFEKAGFKFVKNTTINESNSLVYQLMRS